MGSKRLQDSELVDSFVLQFRLELFGSVLEAAHLQSFHCRLHVWILKRALCGVVVQEFLQLADVGILHIS